MKIVRNLAARVCTEPYDAMLCQNSWLNENSVILCVSSSLNLYTKQDQCFYIKNDYKVIKGILERKTKVST